MKKRFGAILLSGVMACSVMVGIAFSTGCRGNRKPDFEMPEGGFDVNNDVTITFYHSMGADNRKVLQASLEQFKLLYPNITVVEEAQGGYDDVLTQVKNEIIAGTQPDIAYGYPDHVAEYNQSYAVQALNDFLPGGTYNDYTVQQVKLDNNGNQVKNEDGSYVYEEVSLNITEAQKANFIEGYYNEGYLFDDGSKMYTLPFSKSTEVLYYNKDLFTKYNLQVPKTWDDLEEICKKVKAEDPSLYPFTYDSESNWFITMCEQSGSGYTSSSGNNFLFDNATNRAFIERFKGWYEKGYFSTQAINGGAAGNKYTSDLFTAQKSLMCIGSSAGANNQIAAPTDGKYPYQVGIASMPQVNPDKPKVISQGPSVCVLKQDDPQRVLASWLLVKYLATDVNFQAAFSMGSGYVPVLKESEMRKSTIYATHLDSANENNVTKANITALAAKVCMQQEAAYYTSPAFVGSSTARAQVGNLLLAAVTGTKTIDEAFKYAIAECEYQVG
ncbi:MAG: extracellular solute-binding protein [Clostridia bacterium]|nr:extracellular solute-binding protein [Clostridia bacterium]